MISTKKKSFDLLDDLINKVTKELVNKPPITITNITKQKYVDLDILYILKTQKTLKCEVSK